MRGPVTRSGTCRTSRYGSQTGSIGKKERGTSSLCKQINRDLDLRQSKRSLLVQSRPDIEKDMGNPLSRRCFTEDSSRDSMGFVWEETLFPLLIECHNIGVQSVVSFTHFGEQRCRNRLYNKHLQETLQLFWKVFHRWSLVPLNGQCSLFLFGEQTSQQRQVNDSEIRPGSDRQRNG